MQNNDLALIGLAVMGQNLALNMARNEFNVTVYNRTWSKTEIFMSQAGKQVKVHAASSIEKCMASLNKPRKIILMVQAGAPVDHVIDELLPFLEPGDIIMDGGNSHYIDTERRINFLAEKNINFLGVGVSGGEKGALLGPSIMPGGSSEAFSCVEPILTAIAAKAGPGKNEPCTAFIGAGGAGHFVKMVHNGIEYADMQLIAEAYDILSRVLGMGAQQLANTFATWHAGPLSSYLMEITAAIFTVKDEHGDGLLVDKILDAAGQKGTGRWTTQTALDLGVATPTINAAVEARILSSLVRERQTVSTLLCGPKTAASVTDLDVDADTLGHALFTAKLCSYAQGFAMLQAAEKNFNWGLNYSSIAKIWRAGCIIRAAFLDDISATFEANPGLDNLLKAEYFAPTLKQGQAALRKVVALAVERGVPVPALSASLAYYDSYRSARLPANLIQAQRDFFGAHTYKRVGMDGTFHTQWPEIDED